VIDRPAVLAYNHSADLLRRDGLGQRLGPLPDQLLQFEHHALSLLNGRVAPRGESALCGGDGGVQLQYI
jgi:hypothetical protein